MRGHRMNPVAEIPLRSPVPWAQLLDYLRPRRVPGVEQVEDVFQRRTGATTVRVAPDPLGHHLRVSADGPVVVADVLARITRLFALDEDHAVARMHLQSCPLLAPRIARAPLLRPLGCWDRFELCVRTVLGQQVAVAAAGTLMQRLVDRCGEITPTSVMAADLEGIGMPGARVDTLRSLAAAHCEGRLCLHAPWPQVDAALRALPGFGPWTRAYLAIRLGREPDAFPDVDVGLRRAVQADSPQALLRRAQAWRPYRSLAASYLWMT